MQLCLDQQAFRLPDGAGLGVPLVEALLRKQQWAVAPSRCERRLNPAESPTRNTETTSVSMWTALANHEEATAASKGPT